jgi:hypothetical protein
VTLVTRVRIYIKRAMEKIQHRKGGNLYELLYLMDGPTHQVQRIGARISGLHII